MTSPDSPILRPVVRLARAWLLVLWVSGCGGTATSDAHAHGSVGAGSSASGSGSGSEGAATGGRGSEPAEATASIPSSGASETTTGPRHDARYYVGVGSASTLSSTVGRDLLAAAGARLRSSIGALPGVDLAPHDESVERGVAVARARALHGVYVRCSVRRVEAGPQGTRAAVAMLVTTFDARDVLASLQGGALVTGGSGVEAERAAIEGAVDSALAGLPTVLASLDARTASR